MKPLSRATPCGETIFCDDIRHELTGKVSLIGVYAGTMFVINPFPTKLAKLCLRVTYQEHPSESIDPVELHVYIPGNKEGEPHLKAILPPDFRSAPPAAHPLLLLEDDAENDGELLVTAMFHVEMIDVPLMQQGKIRVRAFRGATKVRLGSLLILPVPNQQPVAQTTP